ncbi:hypothetical protein [Aeromicrobium sp. UC242_57]|uniref:hypothetical protein n=1 Tax=Aeromicrobium sp. UC242_57 TaxID=3374624 RepID=UPI0037B2EC64
MCSNTVFAPASSSNIETGLPKIIISSDDPVASNLAAGYAAGIKMLAAGSTKAGFVSGIKADFSVAAADGFLAGIRVLIPEATLATTYTATSTTRPRPRKPSPPRSARASASSIPTSVARPTQPRPQRRTATS